jgi:ERCC4-type nuclease
MILIQDSREQTPLSINHRYITETKVQKLLVGDYMVMLNDNHIPPISFERKSQSDAVGTLTQGYSRYRKEIKRAIENKILLVMIIECSLTKFLKGIPQSQRSGEELVQQIFTIALKYRVPFVFCNDRAESSRFILETFLAYGRSYMINKKK